MLRFSLNFAQIVKRENKMTHQSNKLTTSAAAFFLILVLISATGVIAHGQTKEEKAAQAERLFA